MNKKKYKEIVSERPKFHFTPPKGWMNDPNGFIHYKNEFHLFYQANPNDISWGQIEWGHATSINLLDWTHQKSAIKPNKTYDKFGCWSGTTIEKEEKIYLFYTGIEKQGNLEIQTQNLAISENG